MLADLLKPALPELGKIKIGGLGQAKTSRSGGSYRLPVKFDHFAITTLMRDKDGGLVNDVTLMKQLADQGYADADGKLRQLPIVLLTDDIEDVIKCSYLWYAGKKLVARSDGKTVTYFFNPNKLDERLPEPAEREWTPQLASAKDAQGNLKFKLHTVFNCVIASEHARWGGVYKLRTTSRMSGEQLYGSLLQIQQMTCGFLRGIPLRLRLRPVPVAPEGKPSTVYVVYVDIPAKSMLEIRQEALRLVESDIKTAGRMKQLEIEYKRILRAPGYDETDEEIAEVAAEYHPDDQTTNGNGGHVAPAEDDPLMTPAASNGHASEMAEDEIPFEATPFSESADDEEGLDREAFAKDCLRQAAAAKTDADFARIIDAISEKEDWLGPHMAGTLRSQVRPAKR